MPNRIIKESICTSNNLNNLKPEEEIFFYRLLVNCDDFGRMDGRIQIIRAKCYPLKLDLIKEKDIEKWIDTLLREQLIQLYVVNNLAYIQMKTWEKHQQIRAKKSKYPSIDEGKILLKSSDIKLYQKIAYVPVIQSNPIQSESNPNPIPFEEIIVYLNLKAGKSYRSTSDKTRGFITARWNENYTLEDFKKVIDIKASEWKETEQEKYLRPETLFGTKFEGYLNQQAGGHNNA
jgi:uncharacterized phage protein (TIGR02220 family)